MKHKIAIIGVLLSLFCLLFLLAGCGKTPDSDENRELLKNHPLFSLELKTENLSGSLSGSWLAVTPCRDDEQEEFWKIIGCSEEELTEEVLSSIDILAVVHTSQNSAQYRSSDGRTGTGSSQYATIAYYDAKTGDYYGDEELSAGALPEKASSVPDYRITGSKLCKTIKERLDSRMDPDLDLDRYEIKDTVLISANAEDLRTFTIPSFVTEISEKAGEQIAGESLEMINIPASVTKISLPDIHTKVVLGVDPDSYALKYANANGYVYAVKGESFREGYLPDTVTEYDKVRYGPDNYYYLHIPTCVTYIRDGVFSSDYAPFVVEPGSYGEQSALETGHIYCYEGHMEELYVPAGREYLFLTPTVLENTARIHIPPSLGSVGDQMDEYLTQHAAHLTFCVERGSFAESYAAQKGIGIEYE